MSTILLFCFILIFLAVLFVCIMLYYVCLGFFLPFYLQWFLSLFWYDIFHFYLFPGDALFNPGGFVYAGIHNTNLPITSIGYPQTTEDTCVRLSSVRCYGKLAFIMCYGKLAFIMCYGNFTFIICHGKLTQSLSFVMVSEPNLYHLSW